MAKPFILAVDDDPELLQVLRSTLVERYSSEWNVATATSAYDALATIDQLVMNKDVLALLLADERMPRENGVQLIEVVRRNCPEAKCVLLASYSGSDSAVQAMKEAGVDNYVLKPWQPPEECLFPTLDDLLEAWVAEHPTEDQCVLLYGARWDPKTHSLKDFLARNGIPYEWTDIEQVPDKAKGWKFQELPLLELPSGKTLSAPTFEQIGEELGLSNSPDQSFYDLAIIGGGPAGLAAAVYGASEGLSTVLLEREAPGGQAGMSSRIENYLGFPSGLSGADLARRAVTQAKRFGVEFLVPQEAVAIEPKGSYREIVLQDGQRIRCHAVMLATGVSYRRLEVLGEDRLFNKGVYYGATLSEAMSCAEEHVVIVGGANSAGQAALYFAKYAGRVTMLVRESSLDEGMSQYLIDQVGEVSNIEVVTEVEVIELCGQDRLDSLRIRGGDGEIRSIEADAVFIFIGAEPQTDWLGPAFCRDEHGFVLSGSAILRAQDCHWPLKRTPMLLETSVPGVFVAGDVRADSVKRVANSVGEGSIAVHMVHEYLREVRA